MLVGLKSLKFYDPFLISFFRDASVCGESFVQEVVSKANSVECPPRPLLQWAALCHVPIDLHRQDEVGQSLTSLFYGLVVADLEGLSKAAIFWHDQSSIAHYFAYVSAFLYDSGKIDRATRLRQIASDISPATIQSNYRLNRALCVYQAHQQQEWGEALVPCKRATDLRGWNQDWHTLGLAYYHLGRYQEALAAYAHADTVVARYRQALSFEALGDYQSAERSLWKSVAYDPDFEQAYLRLIRLYLEQNRPCDAYAIVEKVFQEDCDTGKDLIPQEYCDLLENDDLRECK